ncbi:class I SAM-dependent DNA methyltransferase [Cryobacterium arcticum]|uniref:site-specific DNA-methyltransferase (adenine-specific) n=1 Tax=Cryobacterium arcticum TaxID=670052 RepID=A0A1B1BQP5_9MICO|nr:DNA methyltransferase [Cryobacterium arcticum]ANP74898.1 Methylase [Cryobacterium arcticum]
MPAPTLNEVRELLRAFSLEWAGAHYERGQAQGFWREFFACFGISGQSAVLYEHQVRKLGGAGGYIDSFIPGKLIVEAKSKGRNLVAAFNQAEDYALALPEAERPRWVIVSDFETFRITDLSKDETVETDLAHLSAKAHLFRFLIDEEVSIVEEREIDRSAAYKVSKLHTVLLEGGLHDTALDVFLTRLLFCFFADDTGLFHENGAFNRLVKRTIDNQLGNVLGSLFQTLDKDHSDRQAALDEDIARFPHVNGSLFRERLDMPAFSGRAAQLLRECSALDWAGISPAIFGAMFQGILEGEYEAPEDAPSSRQASRRETGSHYTSERNILKVIQPLFLDELRVELEAGRTDRDRLHKLYNRLPNLTFLDPACGCGSFLVIAYREIRRLEMDILDVLLIGKDRTQVDVAGQLRVTVRQFHGIELGESPAEIARVAMWITDHQMSMEAAARFGSARRSLPLRISPTIKIGNALRIAWETVIPATHCDYIIGNPPFIGKKEQTPEQKADLKQLYGTGRKALIKKAGNLDYVTGWFVKAAQYIQGSVASKIELDLWAEDATAWGSKENEQILDIDAGWQNWQPTRVGFVSTNSITQGEQVGVLWGWMLDQGVHIQYAHRTFEWRNEGKGNAAVHVVIVGFGLENPADKELFDYPTIKSDPIARTVATINPYLAPSPSIIVVNRQTSVSASAPVAKYGSMPIDDGHLTVDGDALAILTAEGNGNLEFVRPYVGGRQVLAGTQQHAIWLTSSQLAEAARSPFVRARIAATKEYRSGRKRPATAAAAVRPYAFAEIRQPTTRYLAVPKVSSERRDYLPMAFMEPNVIASGSLIVIEGATLAQFGILSSAMHNAWMRAVAGRMKSDYQYSVSLVYNNFPWPTNVDTSAIETAAQAVIDVRADFPTFTLAQLYDRELAPEELAVAHKALDAAVDAHYHYNGPKTDLGRTGHLFELLATPAAGARV